jgi:hypothetical protein
MNYNNLKFTNQIPMHNTSRMDILQPSLHYELLISKKKKKYIYIYINYLSLPIFDTKSIE